MGQLLPEHLKHVKGVGIVIVQNNKVLLGLRTDNGQWSLPGGSIEEGEFPKEAAIRELYEEFGIIEFKLKYYGVSFSPADHGKLKNSMDGCSIDFCYEYNIQKKLDIKIEPREFSEYTWVHLGDILYVNLFSSSRSSLETFLRV